MKPRALILIAALTLSLAACGRGGPSTEADPPPRADPITQRPAEIVPDGDPRIALAAKMPGTSPADLRITPIANIYELEHEGEITYITADGAFVFAGDLYQVTTSGQFPNLTDLRRRELRRELLAESAEKDMIVFGPRKAAHTISVFTDVDCQWCQRMHAQIAEYNALGIRVRYMSYPRTGPDTDAWHKAENVWCAKDRKGALTEAKHGGEVARSTCDAPIARQYRLGQLMGITGTPGVIFDTGELVPGYLPPDKMLRALEESAAGTPGAG